jgi:hypothetical protein
MLVGSEKLAIEPGKNLNEPRLVTIISGAVREPQLGYSINCHDLSSPVSW